MTIVANNLHGDYQLANGYGHDKAKEVLKVNIFPPLCFFIKLRQPQEKSLNELLSTL